MNFSYLPCAQKDIVSFKTCLMKLSVQLTVFQSKTIKIFPKTLKIKKSSSKGTQYLKALGLIPSRARLIESLSLKPKNWTFESPAVRTHKCLWRDFRYFCSLKTCIKTYRNKSSSSRDEQIAKKKLILDIGSKRSIHQKFTICRVILGIFGFWISLFQLATISRSLSQSALSFFHVKCVCQVWLAPKLKNTIDLWKLFVCMKKYRINSKAMTKKLRLC